MVTTKEFTQDPIIPNITKKIKVENKLNIGTAVMNVRNTSPSSIELLSAKERVIMPNDATKNEKAPTR
jgi:hypothetical protein